MGSEAVSKDSVTEEACIHEL